MQRPSLLLRYLLMLFVLGNSAAQAAVIGERPIVDGTPASGPRVLWQGHHALLAYYDPEGILSIMNPEVPSVIRKVSPQGSPLQG